MPPCKARDWRPGRVEEAGRLGWLTGGKRETDPHLLLWALPPVCRGPIELPNKVMSADLIRSAVRLGI